MRAIARRGVWTHIRESALKVDWEKKNLATLGNWSCLSAKPVWCSTNWGSSPSSLAVEVFILFRFIMIGLECMSIWQSIAFRKTQHCTYGLFLSDLSRGCSNPVKGDIKNVLLWALIKLNIFAWGRQWNCDLMDYLYILLFIFKGETEDGIGRWKSSECCHHCQAAFWG